MLLASLSDVFFVGSNAFGLYGARLLATHSIRIFPLHFPPVRRRVPSGSERAIPLPEIEPRFVQTMVQPQ